MLLLLGCTTSCAFGPPPFEVTVDALAGSGGSTLRSYSLASGNAQGSVDDLQFQEFARYLERALQAQGFSAASNAENAELNIVLSFGVKGPFTKEENYSRAIWGQTGFRAVYHYPHGTENAWCRDGGRYYYQPRYGVTGYATGTRSVTTYAQYITIEAFPAQALGQEDKVQVVWRVDLESVGKRNDLRQGFPIMLAAATPYLGSNSGQKLELELNEDDEAVQFLKGTAVR
jgi:hypothetical protein